MKKRIARTIRRYLDRWSPLPEYYHPVEVISDGGPAINMCPGDTTDITWDYKIEFDAERNVAILYSRGEYIGEISHRESYIQNHKMSIKFSSQRRWYR